VTLARGAYASSAAGSSGRDPRKGRVRFVGDNLLSLPLTSFFVYAIIMY